MASKNDQVRALTRGLRILKFINSQGQTKVADIAAGLDIPRPSVYRLLHTLEEEGYVVFSTTDARVRVTAQAASLGSNADGRSLICQAAGPILNRFTKAYTWPIDLTVYEDAHMVIQETTHPRSALSVDRNMVGFPLPMLRSSAGRAYLGCCSSGEREHILSLIRSQKNPDDLKLLKSKGLDQLLSHVKRHGYAIREGGSFRPKTASIAVPIISNGDVYGCVSVIWVSKALTVEQAIDRYKDSLFEVAGDISERLGLLIRRGDGAGK